MGPWRTSLRSSPAPAERWKARDVEVDDASTLDDLADALRSASIDDQPVLAVIEHEDEWFAAGPRGRRGRAAAVRLRPRRQLPQPLRRAARTRRGRRLEDDDDRRPVRRRRGERRCVRRGVRLAAAWAGDPEICSRTSASPLASCASWSRTTATTPARCWPRSARRRVRRAARGAALTVVGVRSGDLSCRRGRDRPRTPHGDCHGGYPRRLATPRPSGGAGRGGARSGDGRRAGRRGRPRAGRCDRPDRAQRPRGDRRPDGARRDPGAAGGRVHARRPGGWRAAPWRSPWSRARCARGALVLARVSRLVFGAWDPKTGAVGSLWDVVRDARLNHRVEVVGGVLEAECADAPRGFFRPGASCPVRSRSVGSGR